MIKFRFTEFQIVSILNQPSTGQKVSDICCKHSISDATFYNWKAKYGGMSVSELVRMKELEAKNVRLKRMYADLSLVHHALKDAIEKSCKSWPQAGNGYIDDRFPSSVHTSGL